MFTILIAFTKLSEDFEITGYIPKSLYSKYDTNFFHFLADPCVNDFDKVERVIRNEWFTGTDCHANGYPNYYHPGEPKLLYTDSDQRVSYD